MPIRYKVVKRKTRGSAIINGRSHFARKYLPGTTVFAEEGTLGIMVFKTRYSAVVFADHFNNNAWYNYHPPKLIIIKVETIGRGKVIHWVSSKTKTDELESYYKDMKDIHPNSLLSNLAPDDTIAYPGVRVLE
jgi:hypothetical protein